MKKLSNPLKRKLVQIAAFGFSNAHGANLLNGRLYQGPWKQFCNPGLNCYSCPAASVACPIGAMQAVSGAWNFDFSFYAVGFILAVGVLFGRFICGWICPFGLIQELIHKLPTPKGKLPKAFRWLKYGILAVFVIALPVVHTNYMGMGKPAFCQYICPSGTLLGGIPMLLTHPELSQSIGSLFFLKLSILAVVVVCCVFFYRFFCKSMCPLGAIYGLLNRISILGLRIDRERCVSCGRCASVCKMDVAPHLDPRSAECIRCGACVSACGQKAITLGATIRLDPLSGLKGKQ